ncbi:MAG TPA: hypothetical protein VN709_09810 [Terriglobales bacterium]|nr:hypothetical protein [Terriglobales bacterium]
MRHSKGVIRLALEAGAASRPSDAVDIQHSLADIAAAKRDLRYGPVVGLYSGLQRTLQAHRPALAGS